MRRVIQINNQPMGTLVETPGEPLRLIPPIITVAGELRSGEELCLAVIASDATDKHCLYQLATETEFRSLLDQINTVGALLGAEVLW